MREQSVQAVPAKFECCDAQLGRPAILAANPDDVLPQHRSIYSDLDTHRLESKQHAVAGAKCRSEIKPAPVRSDVAGDHEQRGREKV
jgi:hypothetical protein